MFAESNGKAREPAPPQVGREVISEHTSRVVETTPGKTTVSVTIERTIRERKLVDVEVEEGQDTARTADAPASNVSVTVHAIGSPAPFPGTQSAAAEKEQPATAVEGAVESQTLQSGVSTTSAVSSDEPTTVLSASLSLPPLSEEPSASAPDALDAVDARESSSAMAELETFRHLIEERQEQSESDAIALGDTTRVECAPPATTGAEEEVDESAQVTSTSSAQVQCVPTSDSSTAEVEALAQSASSSTAQADQCAPPAPEPQPEPQPEVKSAVPDGTRQYSFAVLYYCIILV